MVYFVLDMRRDLLWLPFYVIGLQIMTSHTQLKHAIIKSPSCHLTMVKNCSERREFGQIFHVSGACESQVQLRQKII